MMMYRTNLLAVTIGFYLLGAVAAVEEESTATSFLRKVIYGEQESHQGGPLDCALSGATDSGSCTKVSTDNGEKCVWCTSGAGGAGVCVTPEQAESVERFGFQCGKDDGDDDSTGPDDDKTPPASDDDFHMDDLLGCLVDGVDAKDCASSSHGCVWCTSKLYGVCITKQASETIAEYKFFDCPAEDDIYEDGDDEEEEDNYGDVVSMDATTA